MHPTRNRDTYMDERPENYMEENQNVSNEPTYSQGPAMKKCPYCNANIAADSAFCEYCGAKVGGDNPVTSSAPAAPATSASNSEEDRPKNYLGLAIACIIFCWPLGIPSVVNASKVNRLWDEGRYEEAKVLSDKARSNATTGLIIGIIINVAYVIFTVMTEM